MVGVGTVEVWCRCVGVSGLLLLVGVEVVVEGELVNFVKEVRV